MPDQAGRLLSVWRRTASVSWPLTVQQTLSTLMRTVDIVVTGLFSPAAVAAIGLADLYSDIPRQVGSALGAGAIALSSQDTGRGATETRDQAVSQALLLGFLAGVPFVFVGALFARPLIAVLGAPPDVARLGGTYLLVVFAAGPMRVVGYVGAKALQGTGDTRTPMYVNVGANALNIAATVGLGLGLWGFPRLGIVGVGVATAVSRTVEALVMLAAIHSERTAPSLAHPTDFTITRQIAAVGLPRFGEQVTRSASSFPFNALVLLFGTEVNAAYHVARRIYQQFVGPVYRSLSTATSIVVGERVGEGNVADARYAGFAIVALSLAVMVPGAVALFLAAPSLASAFSNDAATVRHATAFTRTFAVSMLSYAVLFPLTGALRGAGDTRTPLYAQFTGRLAFLLGFSYLVAVVLDYGLLGVYAGIVLTYTWRAVVVGGVFLRGRWADTAAEMIADRGES
jgi:putative MATE family efflux protein